MTPSSPSMRLADAAIVAVRALMAAERAALKEMAGGAEVEDWCTTLFADPDCVLFDAERTLAIMKSNAEDAALRGAIAP